MHIYASTFICVIVYVPLYRAIIQEEMGSFAGHAVPGSFFLLYGIWWIFVSYWHYFYTRPISSRVSKAKLKKENELNRRSTLPTPCCPRLPLESLCKIALSFCGILVETVFNWNNGIVFDPIKIHSDEDFSRMQHATMYSFFLLSGIVDMCIYCIRIPKNSTKLFLALAFFIEGMLFYFHTEQRDELNQRAHLVLTWAIFGCTICAATRMYVSDSLLLNAGLGFFITFQGSWFYQVAIVLYGKHSDEWVKDEKSPMYMGFGASWHVMVIAVSMMIVWIFMANLTKNTAFQRFTSLQKQRDIFARPLLDSDDSNLKLIPIKNIEARDAETII